MAAEQRMPRVAEIFDFSTVQAVRCQQSVPIRVKLVRTPHVRMMGVMGDGMEPAANKKVFLV